MEKKIVITSTPTTGGYAYKTLYERQQLHEQRLKEYFDQEKTKTVQKTTDQRFSKAQWKEIYRIEEWLRKILTEYITQYVTGSVLNNVEDIHNLEFNPAYTKLNAQWRDYVRIQIVPQYPLAKTNKDVRNKLFDLFPNKLKEALENIKKKNE